MRFLNLKRGIQVENGYLLLTFHPQTSLEAILILADLLIAHPMRVFACLMNLLLTTGTDLLPEGGQVVVNLAEIENLPATTCENS
jgi:hypothetical protein